MNYPQLKNYVLEHSRKYYDLSTPSISDAAWDEAYDKLEAMEKAQGWRDSDSPTLKVGGAAGKVSHPYTLYSLRKIYEKDELDEWMDVRTPKIDGTNLTIIYKAGKMHLALTRGNGDRGDDVTELAREIANIPQKISTDHAQVVINGECVTDNDVENFRNYVSGALGLKSPSEFKERNIKFIAHDILSFTMNYTNKIDVLQNMGFFTVLDDAAWDYPCDGVVYRCNDWQKCQNLGYTSKYPRFAVALKSRETITAVTTLKEVLWTVGRTGVVSPTGVVDPVVLDDATISRVTLHNIEQIESHNLGFGDRIEIERAGGVIPKFLRVIEHSPHNLKITKKHAEESVDCKLKRVGPKLFSDRANSTKVLEHFIKTLDIKGLGPASVRKLKLMHPVDLFDNPNWDILGANGAKIEEEIERTKTKPYSLVLAALGIPGVGKRAAKLITRHISRFHNLRDVEVTEIKGVGPSTIDSILTWLDENEGWVETLPLQLEEDLTVDEVLQTPKRKICITGKMDMSRSQLGEHLQKYGFAVASTVTKDCYALISGGDDSSSKYKKAQKQKVTILDYWKNKSSILNGEF